MEWNDIAVQRADFDLAELNIHLEQGGSSYGAVVTFTGRARDLEGEVLQALELEHYPGMTEKALRQIVGQARERWALGPIVVRHRVGRLLSGDHIVFVGVASAHRRTAFEATQFIMDYLKRDAPFWKKEVLDDGQRWVAQKASDLSAADAWRQSEDAGQE